jgi:hypothetical protein
MASHMSQPQDKRLSSHIAEIFCELDGGWNCNVLRCLVLSSQLYIWSESFNLTELLRHLSATAQNSRLYFSSHSSFCYLRLLLFYPLSGSLFIHSECLMDVSISSFRCFLDHYFSHLELSVALPMLHEKHCTIGIQD